VAREFAEAKRKSKRTVGPKAVSEMLGKRRFQPEVAIRTGEPGVATGLAWTPVGGDVLFVEATSFPGEGKLQVTGQLGDVMKESAAAALSYVKRNAEKLGEHVPENWFRVNDVHLHVPAGAIPKDGPSAGITMATALASLVSGRPVRAEVAMTGEVTLTGRVLPIGGLKEKALAAQRADIKRVIAPVQNEPDAAELPANLLEAIELDFVETVDEVWGEALEPAEDETGRASVSRLPRPGRVRSGKRS
jgi:ATP-dependent Lon protease